MGYLMKNVKDVVKVGIRININYKSQYIGIVFGGKTYKTPFKQKKRNFLRLW